MPATSSLRRRRRREARRVEVSTPVPAPRRIGVVLGGGGIVGEAYHAGVLAALHHDFGWDPRTADVIVGTSAGAVTGALLQCGVAAADLAGFFVRGLDGRELTDVAVSDLAVGTFAPLRWWSCARPVWPTPQVLARAVRMPWRRRPLTALLSLIGDGAYDVHGVLRFLDDLADSWPQGLRIVAVRQRDGARVVFGTDRTPSLSAAVAASCAIPGYFRSVEIDGERYIDGGAHSPTNADVVADDALDLVLVIAPLSASGHPTADVDGLVRRLAGHWIRDEARAIAQRGTGVIVLEPGEEAVRAMGRDLMCTDACAATVRESFLELGRRSATTNRRLADVLGTRTQASRPEAYARAG
jgi:NTE family protein